MTLLLRCIQSACIIMLHRHRIGQPRRTTASVCDAITRSSSVGITHTDGFLPSREMRGPPLRLASASIAILSQAK
jgi:hypothetical protein